MKTKITSLIALAVILCLTCPRNTPAETFFDLYYGTAETEDDSVKASYHVESVFGSTASAEAKREVSYRSSGLFGLRGGHWFDSVSWLGMALDASYFHADGEGVDIDILPLSALLMFRLPLLADGTFPSGRLQPYAGLGLSYAFADASVDFPPELPQKVDGLGGGWGPDLRAGLIWMATRNFGLFVEYRYLKANLEVDEPDSDDWQVVFTLSDEIEEIAADIATHQFFGGLTFRF